MVSEDKGQIVTVNGRIDPGDLGKTVTHEHLFFDGVDAWFEMPSTAVERRIAEEPISLENLWYIRRNPSQHRENLRLNSMSEAINELKQFQRAGGDTIVDVTPKNVGNDPERVQQIARELNLNIIHGTAYYTKAAHPSRFEELSESELEKTLEEEFVDDVLNGIDDTNIRAGIVGEIGLSDQIYSDEEVVLRAGAKAALRTGAALTVHPPGRSRESKQNRTKPTSRWGLEVLDVIEEEGLSPDRVIIDHMDRSIFENIDYQYELAKRGAYLEYDVWGLEQYYEKFDDSYLSDPQRADAVQKLIDSGYTSQLLFSQDVYTKTQRKKYGGYGYGHILENIVPMLRSRGVKQDEIEQILIDNPRRILTFEDRS